MPRQLCSCCSNSSCAYAGGARGPIWQGPAPGHPCCRRVGPWSHCIRSAVWYGSTFANSSISFMQAVHREVVGIIMSMMKSYTVGCRHSFACVTLLCLDALLLDAAERSLSTHTWALTAGLPLFDKDMNQAEVVSMLLGYTAMPFEANPALFQSINAPPNAQNMLRQMLQRNPAARPALKDVRFYSVGPF